MNLQLVLCLCYILYVCGCTAKTLKQEDNEQSVENFDLMGTDIPPGMCEDLTGSWASPETEAKMVLTQQSDGFIQGTYNGGPNAGWFGLDGRKAVEKPTLGFTSIWAGGDTVTSWTGQCYFCGMEEVIHTKSITYDLDESECLTRDSNEPHEKDVVEDVFYRAASLD